MFRLRLIGYSDRVIKLSLYAIAFYIPISPALVETFSSLSIVAWLVRKILSRKEKKSSLSRNFLSLPVLSYLLASLVASFFSSNHAIGVSHLIFKSVEYSLLFFIVAEVINTKSFLRNILIVLIVIVTLVGIDGLYQYFTGLDFLRGRTIVIAGRIQGPFTTPDDLATYIISMLPLVASLAFLRFKKRWLKFLVIAILVILFICLILVGTNLYSMPLAVLFWFMLGLTVASKNIAFNSHSRRARKIGDSSDF